MSFTIPGLEQFRAGDHFSPYLPDQFSQLARFLLEAPYRAVGPKEQDRVLTEIVLDSLAPVYLNLIQSDASPLILDMGCGSGIPVLPLAATCPHARCVGVDSSVKRIQYATEIAARLDLINARFLVERIEQYGARRAGVRNEQVPPKSLQPLIRSADFVVARGMAKAPEVLDKAAAFLNPHGRLIIYSTESSATETLSTLSERQQAVWNSILHPYTRSGSDISYALMECTRKVVSSASAK